MKKINILAFALLFLLLTSCAKVLDGTNLPRDSFMFINKGMIVKICSPIFPECRHTRAQSAASGVLVAKNLLKESSYILTAEHVCDDDVSDNFGPLTNTEVKQSSIVTISLNGKEFSGNIIAVDEENDLCIIKTGYIGYKPIKFAKIYPKRGERLFNMAAPVGVWNKNSVLIFEGIFSGFDKKGDTLYSIPAFPGSSGSPVLNTKGHLVGMIHSVNRRFGNISYGTHGKKIVKFVKKVLKDEGINWNAH